MWPVTLLGSGIDQFMEVISYKRAVQEAEYKLNAACNEELKIQGS